MRLSRKRMPTKLCVIVEARSDQPGVPAFFELLNLCKGLVSSADLHATTSPCRSDSGLRFGPLLSPSHSTHVFSGLVTTPTSKSKGAGIGPALCNVAITLIEHSWHQLHNNLLHHSALHFSYYRYVDNRFTAHNEHFLSHPAIQTLIHHNFFGFPVELETLEDFHLLGFNIDLPQRTVTYIQPNQSWKIRDLGSQRLGVSGLASRLHAIYTYSYPPTTAAAAADELVRLYVLKGHDATGCQRFLRKIKDIVGT